MFVVFISTDTVCYAKVILYVQQATQSGEPVCEFRSDFKMPFEMLLIGKNRNGNLSWSDFPCQKFFISVPCVVPSRKVPLLEMFKQFLPENYLTLELFARNLQPNTLSVGDEVLKMQHDCWFY